MTTKIISIIVACILMVACIQTTQGNKITEREKSYQVKIEQTGDSLLIELNNGKKWKLNDEMIVHIRNMEKDVNDLYASNSKDYNALSKKLHSNIMLFTSSCTLEGKGHEELHKWLLPFIKMTDSLSKSKNEVDAAKHIKKIESSFVLFNKYFN